MDNQAGLKQTREFLFSIIVSTYNVEPWINAFFESLERQTFDLHQHIEIIVVDDGSTDNSGDIARQWAKKYPENIFYYHKENGGLSSARNFGLDHVHGEWVTFTDPDDLLDPGYFAEVAKFVAGFAGNIAACNAIYMDSATGALHDGHHLRHKFQQGAVSVNLLEQPDFIQISVATAFLRVSALRKTGLRFDERTCPGSENGLFSNLLLLRTGNYSVGFVPGARYLYRQVPNSGLVDTSWGRREKYLNQILYGSLALLREYRAALGTLPAFVQNVALYELHEYIDRMAENRIPFPFSAAELEQFWDVLRATAGYLDPAQVMTSGLPSVPLRTRIILLALQGAYFDAAPCTLLELNSTANQVHLLHWSTDSQQLFLEDAQGRRTPLEGKEFTLEFMGKRLCCGQYVWAPLRYGSVSKVVSADGTPLSVTCGSAVFETLERRDVHQRLFAPVSMLPEPLRDLHHQAQGPDAAQKYGGCWLVMDRMHKADDNAEHFYRWLRKQPNFHKPLYFVLDPASPDWERLRADGFALLPYSSNQHALAAFRAEWLISSNMEPKVFDPFGTKFLFGTPRYKFAYLQHGITKNDISGYMNGAPVDMIVSTAQREYESMLGGSYKFSRRELALCGFPRHDALLAKGAARAPGKIIAFCPTWRWHLYGTEAHITGLDSQKAARFTASDYFKAWNAVTGSERLARLARQYGYELLFFPHPLTSRFVPLYKNAGAFMFKEYSDVASVQDILVDAALMVTDYSSIAMDSALLGRPVGYYQFTETPAFFESHLCTRGYFDDARDGFGPILPDLDRLLDFLEAQMRGGCTREALYTERAEAFFTLRDGQNCRRTYEAILERS